MEKTDIIDAINRRLLTKWPDRTVYVDVCPLDFARPSFWLAVERDAFQDANRFMIRRELQMRLTLYDEKDDHYESSWYRLSKETDAVMKLLLPPLEVGGRHLMLTLKSIPRDPDRAYVQINATWMEPRAEETAVETAPVADSYSMRIQTKIK